MSDKNDNSNDPTTESYKTLQTWLDSQVSGLKANRDAILGEKGQLEQKLREQAEQWKGLDPAKVRALMSKFENDEELKLIGEGKFEEVIQRRTENLRRGLESERDAARTRITELEETVGRKTNSIKSLTIDAQVREIGLSMDPPIDSRALGDAIRAAREIFTLNDEDAVIARRADGSPIIGKDGKSPLGLAEWLKTTFETGKTLWWGSSSGGGANGSGGVRDGKKHDAAALDKMSPRQKLLVGLASDDRAA